MQTSYLIMGEQPEESDVVALQGGDFAARRRELMTKMAEMQADANSKGVPLIPYRRFMATIGYRLPRRTEGANNYSTLPGLGSAMERKDKGTKEEKEK
jgi:hypothetical protein